MPIGAMIRKQFIVFPVVAPLSPDPQQDPYKIGRYMLCGSGVKHKLQLDAVLQWTLLGQLK